MSKIRDLVEKLPYLAECDDADRFSARNLIMFDMEVNDPKSVFASRESDKTGNRLAAAEIPIGYIHNFNMYYTGMNRLRIAAYSQDKKKGRLTPQREAILNELIEAAKDTVESEIDEILPVDIAGDGVWI